MNVKYELHTRAAVETMFCMHFPLYAEVQEPKFNVLVAKYKKFQTHVDPIPSGLP